MFEKSHLDTKRLSMSRVAARSIIKFGGLNTVFIVFAEAAITAQPSKAALRDPGQSRDLKCALLSFHDLELPGISRFHLKHRDAPYEPGLPAKATNAVEGPGD